MSNMRKSIEAALRLNETHVESQKAALLTFTPAEAALLENLRSTAGFNQFPADQLDRHTIKHLLVSTCDQPVSVCEKVANKCERLMIRGDMNESLELTDSKQLTEEWDPKGDLPQGDADTLSSENDGEDHKKPAGEKSKANTGKVSQEKSKHGDKADVAKSEKDGYKNESEDDDKDLDEEDDDDKKKDEAKDDKDLDEEDDDKDLDEEHPDNKGDRDPQMESDDDDKDDMNEEGAEGTQNDAKDPAPEKDRAASSAKYVKGCKQNESDDDDADDLDEGDDEYKKDMEEAKKRFEARKCESDDDADDKKPAFLKKKDESDDDKDDDDLKEDDLSRDDETKDVKDHPDYDKVKKEDPSNSPLDKGPEDPKLESLDSIEDRICDILSESGIEKGTVRWNEAYVRGWNLAMNHRASKLNS